MSEAPKQDPKGTSIDATPGVEVRDLVVAYGPRVILKGVNMTVPRGEVRVILGGSGCGKSTLLKGTLGLVPPRSGTVKLLGEELTGLRDNDRAEQLRRVGVLFQNGALLGSMTVGENVALPLRAHSDLPPDVIRELVYLKLELVDLGWSIDLFPGELSGGMRKRVALARAMVMDPEVLFCDEPSAGLDPLSSAALDELILQMKDLFGMTVVVVTHELQSIATIADSIIFLDQGKALAEGPIDEVRSRGIEEIDSFFARKVDGPGQGGQSLATLLGVSPQRG